MGRIVVTPITLLIVCVCASESRAEKYRTVIRPGRARTVQYGGAPYGAYGANPYGAALYGCWSYGAPYGTGPARYGAYGYGGYGNGRYGYGGYGGYGAAGGNSYGGNGGVRIPAGSPKGVPIFAIHEYDDSTAGGLKLVGYQDIYGQNVDKEGGFGGGHFCAGSGKGVGDAAPAPPAAEDPDPIVAARNRLKTLKVDPR